MGKENLTLLQGGKTSPTELRQGGGVKASFDVRAAKWVRKKSYLFGAVGLVLTPFVPEVGVPIMFWEGAQILGTTWYINRKTKAPGMHMNMYQIDSGKPLASTKSAEKPRTIYNSSITQVKIDGSKQYSRPISMQEYKDAKVLEQAQVA